MRWLFLLVLVVLAACARPPLVVNTMISSGGNASGGNSSWSQAVADALYCHADGVNCPPGGNASWNESKYWSNASASFTTFGYIWDNYPTFSYTHSYVASVGNWSLDRVEYYNTSQGVLDNRSWNQSGYWSNATLSFYPLIANPAGYLTSYSETDPVWSVMKTTLPNLTYAQIVASIGNWSLDQGSYYSISQGAVVYLRNSTIPTCAGTDKLTSAGNGVLTCAADQSGGGAGSGWVNSSGSNNVSLAIVGVNVSIGSLFVDNANNLTTALGDLRVFGGVETINAQEYFCDFVGTAATTMCGGFYTGGALAAGTNAIGSGDRNNPGISTLSRVAATASGYQFTTGVTAFLLNGSETFTGALLNHTQPLVNNVTTVRFGFQDSITTTTPVDGLYFEYYINSTVTTGNCFASNNSIRLNTSTANFTFNMSGASEFEFSIVMNASGTGARCEILNMTTGAMLWNGTVSSRIPVQPGRETGAGIVAFATGAGAATSLVSIDYQSVELQNRRRWYN